MRNFRSFTINISLFSLLIWLSAISSPLSAQEKLSAQAVTEQQEAYVGESFVFQIQIEGHDAPRKPDVSGIKDFSVEAMGGQQNSQSSITIVNGKMSKMIRRGYIFSYRLTPKKVGSLTIPAIQITAGGQKAKTNPILIKVIKPTETEDFKLIVELSETQCYVGQPITLTVTWYITKDVEDFHFNLPLLTDNRFDVVDVETVTAPSRKGSYMKIPVGNTEIIGIKDRGRLGVIVLTTLSFQKIIIPQQPGNFTLPLATVACRAITGYRKSGRSRGSVDDFFFSRRNQPTYKKYVIPSNELVLNVRKLPEAGKPSNFNGLVGKYNIEASALPTDVKVGDPITLTILISGPDYFENVELPPLNQQPTLTSDFKIPDEIAAGKIENKTKIFTQTIRAKHSEVTAIPPIELSYFDVTKGEYVTISSEPIPLQVKQTRIVTALDAEGAGAQSTTKSLLETQAEGIAYNYEDLSVIQNQAQGLKLWLNSPLWLTLLGLPPLIYFGIFGYIKIRHLRPLDSVNKQARKAYNDMVRQLNTFIITSPADAHQVYSEILDSLKLYIGLRLGLPPGARTFSGAKRILKDFGIDKQRIDNLKMVFETCEARRFAADEVTVENTGTFIANVLELVKEMERSLK